MIKNTITPEDPSLAQITVSHEDGITAHNFPCPVCYRTHAKLDNMQGECFEPCQKCQDEGWTKLRIRSKILRWFLKLFS